MMSKDNSEKSIKENENLLMQMSQDKNLIEQAMPAKEKDDLLDKLSNIIKELVASFVFKFNLTFCYAT